MFLRFLALEGFKSFPEWNGLELSPGISVLVGMNGTGKSNVTDAISWALGEDDPHVLRSRTEADLVFCGSEDLLPTQQAEVSVVFDPRPRQAKGFAPLPPTVAKHGQRAEHTGELPEGALTVTRVRPREGEDHYLVDGRTASREAVRDTMAEAGLGFPLVSVIRQGELERLLLLEPAERRRTIEEAAGVPHLSVQARHLAKERDALRLEKEHVGGELEHARRSRPVLEEEATQLELARKLDADLALARSRALEAVHAACVPAGTDLAELLELLGLPGLEHSTEGNDDGPASDWTGHRDEAVRLAEERAALGEVNLRADADLKRLRVELASLEQRSKELEAACGRVEAETRAVQQAIQETFAAALTRVEQRFRGYYGLLAPGGEAGLPLVETPGKPQGTGVEVVARPPGKLLYRVNSLSGGERSLAALSFALALFQEYASPLFILDEVEPALDDANIRRLQAVLDRVAEERQLIVVSHQQRAKETGDVVFGVERNLDGASQVKFRYEPATLRLEVFRRTWAADHLRRDREQGLGAPPAALRDTRPTVVGTSGSPTQATIAELFAPASGSSRRSFHDDGTFRGIMDAMREREEQAPPEPAAADANPRPEVDAAETDDSGPGCC